MKSKAKKLISLCAASLALSAVLSVGIAAVPLTPSYQEASVRDRYVCTDACVYAVLH